MARVEITTAGHTVTVESDDEVDALAVVALDLWRQTRDPKLDRGWGVTGLVTEVAQPYWADHDTDMGGGRACQPRDAASGPPASR